MHFYIIHNIKYCRLYTIHYMQKVACLPSGNHGELACSVYQVLQFTMHETVKYIHAVRMLFIVVVPCMELQHQFVLFWSWYRSTI